jgi:hypothetical protein
LAPIAELPVLEVVSAVHILADLTLGLGKDVHDYLPEPRARGDGRRPNALGEQTETERVQAASRSTRRSRGRFPRSLAR